jgi:hypothetical protein
MKKQLFAVRAYSKRHPDELIWNAYYKQEIEPNSTRLTTKTATIATVIHQALKSQIEDMFWFNHLSVEDLTYDKIVEVVLSRLKMALVYLKHAMGNYLRNRQIEGEKTTTELRMEAQATVLKIDNKVANMSSRNEAEIAIKSCSADQIVNSSNLFFVEQDYYLRAPAWLYKP